MAVVDDLFLPLVLCGEEDIALLHVLEDDDRAVNARGIFNLRDFPEARCLSQFRFTKADIFLLCRTLRIPDPVIGRTGVRASASFALCLVLRRLAYPNRWDDLTLLFGRTPSQLSVIFHATLEHILFHFAHKLSNLNQAWVNPEIFARAVEHRGAPLRNCWGFIDGTCIELTRPSEGQDQVYSGHKRKHVIKFQAVVAPNGMVVNLSGPYAGRRHDSGILAESGLLALLERTMNNPQGDAFCLFGDPAYPLHYHLMVPFRTANLTPDERAFNRSMATVRQAVEWSFGKVTTIFAFVDFRKNLKLFLQPVGKYYILATLLANCHTCLYGSETCDFFQLDPPTLEQYLS